MRAPAKFRHKTQGQHGQRQPSTGGREPRSLPMRTHIPKLPWDGAASGPEAPCHEAARLDGSDSSSWRADSGGSASARLVSFQQHVLSLVVLVRFLVLCRFALWGSDFSGVAVGAQPPAHSRAHLGAARTRPPTTRRERGCKGTRSTSLFTSESPRMCLQTKTQRQCAHWHMLEDTASSVVSLKASPGANSRFTMFPRQKATAAPSGSPVRALLH